MSFLIRLTRLTINNTIGQQFKQLYKLNQLKNDNLIQNIIQRNCSSLQPELKNKLDKLVKKKQIVLFMKGDKDSPKCGFSNVITQILRMHGVDYDSVNVLDDEEIRQGIKEYSQWPTIPQLFIDGEFIGGCDIVMQMHQNGDLISLFNKTGIKSILKDAASSDK